MRGSELAEAMVLVVDRLVHAREGTYALDNAIEATVDKIGWFSGKDATSYLEAYKSKMQMRNIPEDRQLTGFPRIVTSSIHTEVIEVQAGCRDWADFAERILEQYNFDDSLRLSKKAFMDWVDNPSKGRKTSTLLQEFESQFARVSTLDQTMLDTSKVLLFVKSFDLLDRDNVDLLLETNDDLTVDWAVVKGVCGRINKHKDWKEKGSSPIGPTVETRSKQGLSRREPKRKKQEGCSSWAKL